MVRVSKLCTSSGLDARITEVFLKLFVVVVVDVVAVVELYRS